MPLAVAGGNAMGGVVDIKLLGHVAKWHAARGEFVGVDCAIAIGVISKVALQVTP